MSKQFGLRTLWVWIAPLVAIWILNLFTSDYMDPYLFTVLMYAGINIILAVSLNLVNGFTGQFSMGHAGFMSVGGYTAAFITYLIQVNHPAWLADSLSAN